MPLPSTVILDIESIPDSTIWSPKEENEFAPQYAHIPIVIGTIVLSEGRATIEPYTIDPTSKMAEKELLSKWNSRMTTLSPLLVTWWGRNFDMPVLGLRSLRHGVPNGWYYANKNYRYRYSEECHLDLCDVMSEFGSVKHMKLDMIAKLIGLPGKYGVDGGKVQDMYLEGKLQEIEDYCITDCFQTAGIYLRWKYLKGRMALDLYRNGMKVLLDTLAKRPRTNDFISAINMPRLMLEEESIEIVSHVLTPTEPSLKPEKMEKKASRKTRSNQ